MATEQIHVGNRTFRAGTPYTAPLAALTAAKGSTVQQVPGGMCLVEAVGAAGNEVAVIVKASFPASAALPGTGGFVPAGKLRKVVGRGHFKEVATMLETAYGMPPPRKWEPPAVGRFTLEEVAVMLRIEPSSVRYYIDKADIPHHSEKRDRKTVVFLRHTAVAALHDACCPQDGFVRIPQAVKLTGLSRNTLASMENKGLLATRCLPVSGAVTYSVTDLMAARRSAADYGPSLKDKSRKKARRTRTIAFHVKRGATLGDLVDAMADAPEINNVLKGTSFKIVVYDEERE